MAAQKKQLNPLLKLVLDIGPLVLFFVANSKFGIFAATGAFMVAVLAALAISYVMTRHIAVMPVVTAVIVLIFGGLTLVLHDELFIKLKPTIIYVLFGGTLVGGMLFGKPLLGIVFDSVFHLREEGWRKLTWRWAFFFFALAILNEIVWRTQTTDVWVSFKLFGVVPLTFLFAALQYPLLSKYSVDKNPDKAMDFSRVWKSIAAGLCGSAAHTGLMALKSWARILPSFEPYSDLQALLASLVGSSVHPAIPWVLSYFNGSVVLGFLFGQFYSRLPGRTALAKGTVFGLAIWIVMGLTFFPAIGKGPFAMDAGLGLKPTIFSLLMVLTYSITLSTVYSVFGLPKRPSASSATPSRFRASMCAPGYLR